MDSSILSAAQVKAAKNELGISQRKLANDAGVNRTLLSQFEQQKIVPSDEFLGKLRDYLEGKGVDLDELSGAEEAEKVEPAYTVPTHARRLDDRRIRDGFVLPGAMSDDEADELIEELERIDERVAGLQSQGVEYDWFGDIRSRCDECQDELKTLMAHSYCIVRKLQGHDVVEPCVLDDKPETQADWLGKSFSDALSFLDEDEAA